MSFAPPEAHQQFQVRLVLFDRGNSEQRRSRIDEDRMAMVMAMAMAKTRRTDGLSPLGMGVEWGCVIARGGLRGIRGQQWAWRERCIAKDIS